jgi:choice-of-anchor A domain-containing protein
LDSVRFFWLIIVVVVSEKRFRLSRSGFPSVLFLVPICVKEVLVEDPIQNAPPAQETSDCIDMMNLGYGFSAAMHDPTLGSSHFEGCFPDVQQMPNPPAYKGHDDSIAVLIGGDYTVVNGAELEGNVVVMGNMHIGSSGLSNLVSVGWGSQIVPNYGGKCVQVGGDLSADRYVDVFFGPGYCDVVYKGNGLNNDKWRHAREVIHDPNLDLSKYANHMENLQKKSEYWSSLPPTNGASTNVHWGRMTLTCSNNNEIQVFHISASTMSTVNDIYVYTQSCLDKTILVNVADAGDITMPAKEFRWTDSSGTVQRGGWENFDHCMNSNILWNFPYASKVTFDGYNEWNGSILVTGDFVFKTIGQSGRTMVLGSVTQDRGGSEFHSFQFNPPIPLPDLDCVDYVTSESQPPIVSTTAISAQSYECVWPEGASGYTLITKDDATTASHSHYTKVAVGGTLTDGAPYQSATVDGKVYYGSLTPGYNINFNKGKQQISSLGDIPLDFSHFEWLATNIEAGSYGSKKVFVIESPKSTCYNLYDFVNGGQPGTGAEYLVVVKSSDPICFTKTNDGRQFGPTVLAPFSKVTLMGDAGYIDGTVIAKSFTTAGGNAGSLQLHGKFYSGSITCPTDIQVSSTQVTSGQGSGPNTTPAPVALPTTPPTKQPVAPPTTPPTKQPVATPQPTAGGGCCSQNWKQCLNNPGWCGNTKSDCDRCGQTWLPSGPQSSTCVARWGDCTSNASGCCSPGRCVKQNNWYSQCL